MFVLLTIAVIISEICVGTNNFGMMLFGGLFTAAFVLWIYHEAFLLYKDAYSLLLKRHYASVGVTVGCLICSECIFVLGCKLLQRFNVDAQYLNVCGSSLGVNTGVLLVVIVFGVVCSVFTLNK